MQTIRLILFACFFLAGPATGAVSMASWNIQNLGWGEQKSYPALGLIGSHFDFIAVQEAMSREGLERFKAALEEQSGELWEMMYSHRIGRGSYKEKYAFVWRSAAIEYVDGAVVYLDTTDRFAREPYSARFRALDTGLEFVAATVHIIFGRSVSDRTPEIKALREYWDWLSEVYDGNPERILLGDFNLPPEHAAWAPLLEVAKPLIIDGASTLSSIDGRYANLYDNIWVAKDSTLPITGMGILRFPELLTQTTGQNWTHKKARRHVSDHAPVYVLLGGAALAYSGEMEITNMASPDTEADKPCVDLNEADAVELERIIHIGPARAKAIVEGRPWGSPSELVRISGISRARLQDIQEQGMVCQ